MKTCEAFSTIIELANTMGINEINKLPNLLIIKIDNQWTVAVNGREHDDLVCKPGGCRPKYPVSPQSFAVWCNGFLFGDFGIDGGVFIGKDGTEIKSFIAAVKAKIEALKNEKDGGDEN